MSGLAAIRSRQFQPREGGADVIQQRALQPDGAGGSAESQVALDAQEVFADRLQVGEAPLMVL